MNRGVVEGTLPWTDAEGAVLAEAYARGGIAEARRALPSRSSSAIYHMAKRLGVKRRVRWTPKDQAKLRTLWGSVPIDDICKELGRTRCAVCWYAHNVLGLKTGNPPPWEYLSHAARRTGYQTSQLRRILRWAHVEIRAAYVYRASSWQRHIVDPVEVDDAIADWHKTETLENAARRTGMCSETLRRRLVARGVVLIKATRKKKSHFRVPSAEVDAAMEAA